MGHSCGTRLWDTLVRNSCLVDTLVGHSWGHSCRTLLSLLWHTLVGHSCAKLLWDTLVGHRDVLQKSRCEAARRAFRMRLPPKVTRQVSKTSISYETSCKSHTSSLQNERFVRDFLQKSHVKAPKRAFRTRLPPKVKRKHPSEHTHRAALPSSFAIPAPPNNIRSPQSQCDSNIHLYHNSQPRIFPRPHV